MFHYVERDRSPVELSSLPSWDVDGPKKIVEHPAPEGMTPLFKPSNEINSKIILWMGGDSSRLKADAVVNAANSSLYPGGGICGILHDAAGPELWQACEKIGHCPTGQAALTPGFNLPAKFVIHAVGPIGENPEKLESAYKSTLALIDGKDLKSVGLCCISTGIYGYPITPATHIAMKTVREFLENQENFQKTDKIIFVVHDRRDITVYYELVHMYFPIKGEFAKKEAPKAESQPAEPVKAEGAVEAPKTSEKPKAEEPKDSKPPQN